MRDSSLVAARASAALSVGGNNSRILKTPELRRVAQKIGYFSAANILQSFEDAEREELDRIMPQVFYRRGEVFYVPAETGEVSYILKKGKVQVYLPAPVGEKQILATLEPNAFFGEMPILGQGMYGARAKALEDAILWKLTHKDVERLLVTHPEIALRLLDVVGHRLKEVETQLEEMMFKTIRARIALLLLRHLSPEGFMVTGFSHQEIADRMGVYRETVTHALNELKRMGLIEIGRKKLTVLNPERLRQLAQK